MTVTYQIKALEKEVMNWHLKADFRAFGEKKLKN